MAKRAASNQLTHDNWDQEEESEDPGTYRTLSADELKNRVIKKAKRSLTGNKEGAASSPFAAFSGFEKSSGSPNPFNFLQKSSSSAVSGGSEVKEKKKNGNSESNRSDETEHPLTTFSKSDSTKPKHTRSIEYYRRLQSLNESIMKWMQLHITKNACCDFTPVFNDYKKHIDTLNVTYPVKTNSAAVSEETPASSFFSSSIGQKRKYEETSSNDSNAEGKKNLDGTDYGNTFSSNTTNTSTFSFGIMKTPSATSSLNAGPTSSSKEGFAPPENKPTQFSFGLKSSDEASKPFTFACTPMEKASEVENADEEVEYVPPKNDSAPVEEKDAIYSKKCKLFFKKGESFVEKGVGFLYLKPLNGKTQLLVRADTALGNILLNIILSDSIPVSRTGKNNVLLVCVPNPPVNPSEDSKIAIPMLIRVKTSDDAYELLQTLNKHKS